jgi:hypothetical protein
MVDDGTQQHHEHPLAAAPFKLSSVTYLLVNLFKSAAVEQQYHNNLPWNLAEKIRYSQTFNRDIAS